MKISKSLLWTILIIFPLGQLTRLPLNLPMINLYFHDFLVAALIFFWLKQKGIKKITSNKLFKPYLSFLGAGLVSLLINLNNWGWQNSLIGSLYLFRWGAYFIVYLATLNLKRQEKRFTINLLILAGWLTAILGLVQYFVYPDFRSWALFNWDPHLYRAVGAFFDPGFIGLIYVLTLVLIALTYWKRLKKLRCKILGWLIIPVYLALALTYTRSAYLALLTAAGIIAWRKKTLKFFLLVAALLSLTILILPRRSGIGTKLERRDSLWARIENWEQAVKITKNSPLFGVGFNNYRWAQQKAGYLQKDWQENHAGAGADNSALFILATTGFIGFFAYFHFTFKMNQVGSLIFTTSMFSWLIHSFFNNSLFYPWLMIWGWLLLGLASDS